MGRCDKNVAGSCPFDAVVFKGNTETYEYVCSGETHNNDNLEHEALQSVIPFGVETDVVTDAVLRLRGFDDWDRSDVPTSGMHAAVAMGLECRSLRLFGFAGESTLDGHEMDASHDIEAEHVLLRQLTSHTLRDDQLAGPAEVLRTAWQMADVSVVC